MQKWGKQRKENNQVTKTYSQIIDIHYKVVELLQGFTSILESIIIPKASIAYFIKIFDWGS